MGSWGGKLPLTLTLYQRQLPGKLKAAVMEAVGKEQLNGMRCKQKSVHLHCGATSFVSACHRRNDDASSRYYVHQLVNLIQR